MGQKVRSNPIQPTCEFVWEPGSAAGVASAPPRPQSRVQLPGSESAGLGQQEGKGPHVAGLSCLVGPPGSQPCRKRGCLKGQITHGLVLLGLSQDYFHGPWGSLRGGLREGASWVGIGSTGEGGHPIRVGRNSQSWVVAGK